MSVLELVISDLVTSIKRYAQAYYSGSPIISDHEFDALTDKLRELDPSNELLRTSGWGYKPECDHLEQVFHEKDPGSLDKIKYAAVKAGYKFRDWFYVGPKLDGFSITLNYDNGVLKSAVTRGDGTVGENVTQTLLESGKIPTVIADKSLKRVKGEALVSWTAFNQLFSREGYSFPRNAIGVLRSESADRIFHKNVTFVAYRTDQLLEISEEHKLLDSLGFITPKLVKFTHEEFVELIDDIERVKSINEDYPTDGLVLTNGVDQVAFKFKDDEVESEITDIYFNLTRTGRMVPVWSYVPVEHGGAWLSNATANNVDYLLESGAGIGAKVTILRANGIIPQIATVLRPCPVKLPTNCPVCDSVLVKFGRDLICDNQNCAGKLSHGIWRFFDYLKVDGLSGTYDHVFKRHNVTSLYDLENLKQKLDMSDLLGPSYNAKVNKSYEYLDDILLNGLTIADILYIASIPSLGWSSAFSLSSVVPPEEFIEVVNSAGDNFKLPTSWEVRLSSYKAVDNLISHINLVKAILKFLGNKVKDHPKEVPESEVTVRFFMTGTLSDKRSNLVRIFESTGAKYDEGNPDLLICNGPSDSAKYKQALRNNLPIMTEAEFKSKYITRGEGA